MTPPPPTRTPSAHLPGPTARAAPDPERLNCATGAIPGRRSAPAGAFAPAQTVATLPRAPSKTLPRTAPPTVHLAGTATLGGAPLFGPLALTLAPGAWTCLLGPSGVGKSTLLRLIAGLDTGADFRGQITATDGLPLPPRTAFMAQGDLLLPWLDVAANTTLGPRLRGERPDTGRARDLIARVGLAPQARQLPRTLSGGQRQRAALARTLMEDRPLVLLDEPFSALDARTRADMQDLAAELLANRTVLLVTHDPAEAARLGHRILVLTESGLTEIDPPHAPPPRATGDPETLAAQARLLARLREAPAAP